MTELALLLERVIPSDAWQVLLAALLGLFIGTERAWRNKMASLRTFSMIAAGSCVFTLLSVHGLSEVTGAANYNYDRTRIAAQVVAGIGFIGGGVIFKTLDRVEGITTAAMIWLTAAVGMACGFGEYRLAIATFLTWLVIDIVAISMHRGIAKVRSPRGGVENGG